MYEICGCIPMALTAIHKCASKSGPIIMHQYMSELSWSITSTLNWNTTAGGCHRRPHECRCTIIPSISYCIPAMYKCEDITHELSDKSPCGRIVQNCSARWFSKQDLRAQSLVTRDGVAQAVPYKPVIIYTQNTITRLYNSACNGLSPIPSSRSYKIICAAVSAILLSALLRFQRAERQFGASSIREIYENHLLQDRCVAHTGLS